MPKGPRAQLLVRGTGFRLSSVDPDGTPGFSGPKERSQFRATEELAEDIRAINQLQQAMFAEGKRSLLVILQGMDTSGKDGVMRSVFTGLNPQGIHSISFKKPNETELGHDFLWRVHRECPSRGMIGVFNRSHYEDVLIVRVHSLVPREVWSKRFRQINDFERHLTENGTRIVKFMLHISKEEQRDRLEERLRTPDKRWKFSMVDVEERKSWSQYQTAYQDAMTRCSPRHAPWYVIPANRKWYRNWAIARILRETLEEMAPKYPQPEYDVKKIRIV